MFFGHGMLHSNPTDTSKHFLKEDRLASTEPPTMNFQDENRKEGSKEKNILEENCSFLQGIL
jgi:hypothetical protein